MSQRAQSISHATDQRQALRADCSNCAALCCVAPAFAKSADFAISKAAGQSCLNLLPDFRCGIHANLRQKGFSGCTVFDCFGAGQQVTQVTFGGKTWRDTPAISASMFAVFAVMRQLQELRWYLAESLMLLPAGPLTMQLRHAQEDAVRLTQASVEELTDFNIGDYRHKLGQLLADVSATVRMKISNNVADYRGADLIGKSLRGADLRGANLRGAYLLGADLRGANLDRADLLGADLRATDLRAARLENSIFLTQPQLNAAKGDAKTTVPTILTRPQHWDASRETPTSPKRKQ